MKLGEKIALANELYEAYTAREAFLKRHNHMSQREYSGSHLDEYTQLNDRFLAVRLRFGAEVDKKYELSEHLRTLRKSSVANLIDELFPN